MSYDPYWLRAKIRERLPGIIQSTIDSGVTTNPADYLLGINDMITLLSDILAIDFSKIS